MLSLTGAYEASSSWDSFIRSLLFGVEFNSPAEVIAVYETAKNGDLRLLQQSSKSGLGFKESLSDWQLTAIGEVAIGGAAHSFPTSELIAAGLLLSAHPDDSNSHGVTTICPPIRSGPNQLFVLMVFSSGVLDLPHTLLEVTFASFLIQCKRGLVHNYLAQYPEQDVRGVAHSALTEREQAVLGMVCEGLTQSAIAGRMFCSESTVKQALTTAYRKLGVSSKREMMIKLSAAKAPETQDPDDLLSPSAL